MSMTVFTKTAKYVQMSKYLKSWGVNVNWNSHSKGLVYSVKMGPPKNIFRGENKKKH